MNVLTFFIIYWIIAFVIIGVLFIHMTISVAPWDIAQGTIEYRRKLEAESIQSLRDWCKWHYLSFLFPYLLRLRVGYQIDD